MPAYIPTVFCETCGKELPYGASTVMRVQDKEQRYIRVRCHGEELRIDFADVPGKRVVAWQKSLDGNTSS
jgi:RNase P subunit RPR2